MTKNKHKQSKLPKLPFQQTETNEPDGSVCQPVQKVEKRFRKNFRTLLTKSGIQKINGVQFRLRMTKLQHKRSKLPKLLFQQTEFNEPANLVSQPVQTVERGSKNFSDPSLMSNKSKKSNHVVNQLRMTENRHKQRQRPELLFQQKLNSVNRLIWFPNQFIRLREALKILQTLPEGVINPKKQTK